MRPTTLILLLFMVPYIVIAQTKTPLLILTNKDGKLVIDGQANKDIKNGQPLKILLDEGDHVIQVIAAENTLTEVISCSGEKQRIVKFDFQWECNSPINSTDNELIVSNSSVILPGALSDSPSIVEKYYAFDKGDQVKFSFTLLNNKGTLNFYFYSYPDDQLIFSREFIQSLDEQKVMIQKRGVYRFVFSTNHLLDRDCEFQVKRIPDKNGNPDFKTNVTVKWDTTYTDVLDTKVRVYSMTNLDNPNKTVVRVNLPKGTTYWVYWIGVGQESMKQMEDFISNLAKNAASLVTDPIYAFGIGLIGELPMFKSTATINYDFADYQNSIRFMAGDQYMKYTFKDGNNVTTDYSKINVVPDELNICLWNTNTFTGHDVQIKVGAFKVSGYYVPE